MSDFNEPEESPITIDAAFTLILNAHEIPPGLAGRLPFWMDVKPYFSNFVPRIPDTPYILDAHRMPSGILPLRGKGALLQIEVPAPPLPPLMWTEEREGTSLIPVFKRKSLPRNLVVRIPRAINPVPKEHRRVSSARRLISKN